MIKRFLKFAVLKVKGRTIVFDDAVRNADLLSLVFRNTLSALRGIIKLRQLVLLGKSVTLRSKYNMLLEKGVTIAGPDRSLLIKGNFS